MIADGSPPDDRRGVGEMSYQLVDGAGVDSVVQFSPQSAVPALDQVDDVHHQNERHRDIDVGVVTGADESTVVPRRVVHGQLTPGKCHEAGGYEDCQQEALPVTLTAQRPAERQPRRLLLHTNTHNIDVIVRRMITRTKFKQDWL